MEELVKKAINKDEEAFNKLILLMEKEMYIVAKAKLKNEDDIADAMQETILKCYKNVKKLRNYRFFKTWTIKILINECNKIFQKKAKYKISLEENEIDNYIRMEENYDENIEFDLLISSLNSDEKIILTLYYCSGYTTKEISKILKKNENTIRSKMSRAKTKLKKQYEEGTNGRN